MNARLLQMVREAGARLDGIYFCPHRPEENCECRKPRPSCCWMPHASWDSSLRDAVVIGDKQATSSSGARPGADHAGERSATIGRDAATPIVRGRLRGARSARSRNRRCSGQR